MGESLNEIRCSGQAYRNGISWPISLSYDFVSEQGELCVHVSLYLYDSWSSREESLLVGAPPKSIWTDRHSLFRFLENESLSSVTKVKKWSKIPSSYALRITELQCPLSLSKWCLMKVCLKAPIPPIRWSVMLPTNSFSKTLLQKSITLGVWRGVYTFALCNILILISTDKEGRFKHHQQLSLLLPKWPVVQGNRISLLWARPFL